MGKRVRPLSSFYRVLPPVRRWWNLIFRFCFSVDLSAGAFDFPTTVHFSLLNNESFNHNFELFFVKFSTQGLFLNTLWKWTPVRLSQCSKDKKNLIIYLCELFSIIYFWFLTIRYDSWSVLSVLSLRSFFMNHNNLLVIIV